MLDSTVVRSEKQAAPGSGIDPSLGNIAKTVSTPSQSRKIRYYLQSLARELLPDERVAECLRKIAPFRALDGVDVMYSPCAHNARYRNLIICGRLWFCPVCAARITEKRREELSLALAGAPYKIVLVTYTIRHNKGQALRLLLDGLLSAFRKMKQGRAWVDIKHEFGWVGSVRALEVTEGSEAFDNGWHAHIHELVFLPADAEEWWFGALENHLQKRWRETLNKVGLDASLERGVTVRAADEDVREYVAKYGHDPVDAFWTVERELVKGASKVGKKNGRTPFQLLWDYGEGDKLAGALFVEYARVFKGRNQLVWSPGLRELLGLGGEASDDQAAAAPLDENEFVLANLTPSQWRVILARSLRAELLDVASLGDEDRLWDWLVTQGVPVVKMVNATDLMRSEYEKEHGGTHAKN